MNSENLPGVLAVAAIAITAASMIVFVPGVQTQNTGTQETKTPVSSDVSAIGQTAQNDNNMQQKALSSDSKQSYSTNGESKIATAQNKVTQSKYDKNANSNHAKTTDSDKQIQSTTTPQKSSLSQVDIPSSPDSAENANLNLISTQTATASKSKPVADTKQTGKKQTNSLSDRIKTDDTVQHAKRGKIIASTGTLDVTVYDTRTLGQGWKAVTFRVYNDSQQPQVANLKVESDGTKKYSHAGGVYPNSYKEAGVIVNSDSIDSLKVTIMQ